MVVSPVVFPEQVYFRWRQIMTIFFFFSRLFCFWFLCGRLSWPPVSFSARVNITRTPPVKAALIPGTTPSHAHPYRSASAPGWLTTPTVTGQQASWPARQYHRLGSHAHHRHSVRHRHRLLVLIVVLTYRIVPNHIVAYVSWRSSISIFDGKTAVQSRLFGLYDWMCI